MAERRVVHRGYSASNRQVGTVYNGWLIVERRHLPEWLAKLRYEGKRWEFIGERRWNPDASRIDSEFHL